MNPFPDYSFWFQTISALGLSCAAIVLTVRAITFFLRSSFWIKTFWQTAILALFLHTVVQLVGGSERVFSWWSYAPEELKVLPVERGERKWTVRYSTVLPLVSTPVAVSVAPDVPLSKPAWWVGAVWLAGYLFLTMRWCLAHLILWKWVRTHTSRRLSDRVQELSQRLGWKKKVSLFESDKLTSPVAFGLFRPAIVLPINFESQFSLIQQDAILFHELAHLKSRDPFWYALTSQVMAMHWWNPFVWWCHQALQKATEKSADEAAAFLPDGPVALAEALVDFGKRLAGPGFVSNAGAGVEGFRSNLGQRVENLLHLVPIQLEQSPGKCRSILVRFMILALLLIVGLVQALGSASSATRSPDREFWKNSSAGMLLAALKTEAAGTTVGEAPKKMEQNSESEYVESLSKGLPEFGKFGIGYEVKRPLSRLLLYAATTPPATNSVTEAKFFTRSYKLDTGAVRSFLATVDPSFRSNSATLAEDLPRFLKKFLGKDSDPATTIFHNINRGTLLIRAPLPDFEALGQAIDVLCAPPPQISIETKFAELNEEALADTELSWVILAKADPSNARESLKGISLPGVPVTNSLSEVFFKVVGKAQYDDLVKALEGRPGVDFLTAPKLSTASGRPAQVSAVDQRSVVSGLVTSFDGDGKITHNYQTQQVTTGPVLDVVPSVAEITGDLWLELTATLTEFLGYDEPGKELKEKVEKLGVTIPLPRFRVRQISTIQSLVSGETVVFGGVSEIISTNSPGKIERKHLWVFVTPTVIDPAGNQIDWKKQ